MSGENYITPKEACKTARISTSTLNLWVKEGKVKCIRTTGGHRRFHREDFDGSRYADNRPKRNFCYARVSTSQQKDDLERQVEFFRDRYPNHEIITDTGSGLNFKRRGFKTILDTAIKGSVGEVVVTHKDRLCRFGFDLINDIITTYSNGSIVVLNKQETSPNQELADDIISVITVFSSRLYGRRSHAIKKKKKNKENTGTEGENTEDTIVSI